MFEQVSGRPSAVVSSSQEPPSSSFRDTPLSNELLHGLDPIEPLVQIFQQGDASEIREFLRQNSSRRDRFMLLSTELAAASWKAFEKLLGNGEIQTARALSDFFQYDTSTTHFSVTSQIRNSLNAGLLFVALECVSTFGVTRAALCDRTTQHCAREGILKALWWGADSVAATIQNLCGLSNALADFPFSVRRMASNLHLPGLRGLLAFAQQEREYFRTIVCDYSGTPLLTRDGADAAQILSLSLLQAERLLQANVPIRWLARCASHDRHTNEAVHRRIFDELCNADPAWSDIDAVQRPFLRAATHFGFRNMFLYLSRPNLEPKEALKEIDAIVALQSVSGLSARHFYSNILQQVRHDRAPYGEYSAHHHMNRVATVLSLDIESTLEILRAYPTLTRASEAAQFFSSPAQIFSSWAKLSHFAGVQELTRNSSLFEDLVVLQREHREHARFIEDLLFHPQSRVNVARVIDFWRAPKKFLSAPDEQIDDFIQNRMAAVNLTKVAHLDLSPDDLCRALTSGALDRLQQFPPYQVEYEIEMEGSADETLTTHNRLSHALGTHDAPGAAKNRGKLFHLCKAVFAEGEPALRRYLAGEKATKEQEQEIEEVLNMRRFGLPARPALKMRLSVSVHGKSDPAGALAGDVTYSCDPFGSGKRTNYTFNLGTANLTVQLHRRQGGAPLTIAQSLLTLQKEVGDTTSHFLKCFHSATLSEEAFLNDVVLQNGALKVACDNVEVAPNFKLKKWQDALEVVYRDFFARYLPLVAANTDVVTDAVLIGKGHSDAMEALPEIENTTSATAFLGYTDNASSEVHRLSIDAIPSAAIHEQVASGISLLTHRDVLSVARLEEINYAGSERLFNGALQMQHQIMASQIANEYYNRPHLSLCYTRARRVLGYVLAWQGRYAAADDEIGLLIPGTPLIYVADIAAHPEHIMVGGRLLHAFLRRYQEHFSNGNELPLLAELRKASSYALIKEWYAREGEQRKFDLIEWPTDGEGSDALHPVLLFPRTIRHHIDRSLAAAPVEGRVKAIGNSIARTLTRPLFSPLGADRV